MKDVIDLTEKIAKLKKLKEEQEEVFAPQDSWETSVDLMIEQHSHDLRALTDWCSDLGYMLKQLSYQLEDQNREIQELRAIVTSLVRGLSQ